MDYGKLTLDELKKGYQHNKEGDTYRCNYCETCFETGQVYSMDNHFYMAEHAVAKHIQDEHGGNLAQLLASETKYNTLTQKQRELLGLFHAGVSDKEMAKRTGVTEATIRRQRFTFREKAKQAKYYLAVYEQVFAEHAAEENAIVPIHNKAVYVDDRYLTTEQEKQHILETAFCSLNPLVLKTFSSKEKKKVVILAKIAEQFEKGKCYREKEVNQMLQPIFEDYMTIRRYLIMYGFMSRTKDGSEYRLTE